MSGNTKVFISHAYQDNDACQPLLTALASWDVDYWFQEERAEADESLAPQVEQAIAERDIFLRVLSRAAQASYWVRLETATFQRLRADERRHELMTDAPTGALPGAQSDAETDAPDGVARVADPTTEDVSEDDLQDVAQDEPESEPRDVLSSDVSDDLADGPTRDITNLRSEGADGSEYPARASKRILIDLSLDGAVAGEASDEDAGSDDVYIDMSRLHGLEWREQLRRALGFVELGTETSEVPAVTDDATSEALSLTRFEAPDRVALPEADDRVVSVAIADRPAESGGSSSRGVCLVMVRGNNAGRIYPLLSGRIALGRRRDSEIFLEDVTVSRLHAVLIRDPNGRFVLHDEGSKNGTFVNGQPITERVLEDGDSIRMGQIVLQFRLPRRHD